MESTINAQTINYLTEDDLARLIKSMSFAEEYIVQIFNFFTDIHPQNIVRFIITYNISEKVLKEYYEKYIKEYYPNKSLEEMLSDD